jgi:hypothetical protein
MVEISYMTSKRQKQMQNWPSLNIYVYADVTFSTSLEMIRQLIFVLLNKVGISRIDYNTRFSKITYTIDLGQSTACYTAA